ncbi:MAG: efflux RND transporter permease subunit [Pseudomonadota bacterium]
MNLAEFTIKNTVLSVIVILLAIIGGWTAYQTMPRFEDPEFTIRTAQIVVQYPGASPLEVAEEVADPLERAIQQLQEVEAIYTTASAGVAELKVDIRYEFSPSKADLQLLWTKLRNKVADAGRTLPPGATQPVVYDDFGDVYGLYYFVTGEGYGPSELRRYAKSLQSELLQVDGVAKVALEGAYSEAIFIEISRENAASLGVSIANIYSILEQQNASVAAGDITIGDLKVVIDPSGAIDSVASISSLLVSTTSDGGLVYLSDVANVYRSQEAPNREFFLNGQPAIALAVSGRQGGNIVEIGAAVDQRIAEAESRRPIGIEVHDYYNQGTIVDASVKDFVVNVIAALVIVIVTLLIFMGLKSATVIGAILLLTIFATLATMNATGIPMHRISLGALIIALGMMVDNAIVVTEGILVGVQRGAKKLDIAKSIVDQTKWPLLGGTLVGILAFAPIGFAPGSTAEYTGHLFWVILISLGFSWLFAVTLTPLFCFWLFNDADAKQTEAGSENALMRGYKSLLAGSLKARPVVVLAVVGVFAASVWGFKFVKSGFFPASTTPQLVVDYWLPQGTDKDRTKVDIEQIADYVSGLDGVNTVLTSLGGGGVRFMLVYSPESPNSSYAQLLVRLDDYKLIDGLIPQIQEFVDQRYAEAQAKVWRFQLGPGGGSKIEASFQGPDPTVLRGLAEQAKLVMANDGGALSIKDDWRQPVSVIEPIYSTSKGRRAGVSREDLANALQTVYSGLTVGVYREGDELIPIISRAPEREREILEEMRNIQVLSPVTGATVPIGQVTDGFRTIWRDGRLLRENRIWTIKAQSDPYPEELASELLSRIRADVEAIELPDGYSLNWDGEYGDSKESNENLAKTLPLGLGSMVIVVFILFGTVRQPIIIWLVVPLALIGVVVGLVATNSPLEFMGILGLLSLSGLLIKNAIVLVDQTDFEIAEGKPRFTAVIDAAASRVRPVMMGALTTVLGVVPLFMDAFFKSMAVVLVFGLSFATVLTLLIIPVLYAVFFRIRPDEVGESHAQ